MGAFQTLRENVQNRRHVMAPRVANRGCQGDYAHGSTSLVSLEQALPSQVVHQHLGELRGGVVGALGALVLQHDLRCLHMRSCMRSHANAALPGLC